MNTQEDGVAAAGTVWGDASFFFSLHLLQAVVSSRERAVYHMCSLSALKSGHGMNTTSDDYMQKKTVTNRLEWVDYVIHNVHFWPFSTSATRLDSTSLFFFGFPLWIIPGT